MKRQSTALDSIFDELAEETGGDAEMMKKTFFQKIQEELSYRR